jgi:uncharacterized repeat protein (TIGR01451 family)
MPSFRWWLIAIIAGSGFLSLIAPASAGPSANYFGYITSYGTADSLAWEASHYDLVNCGDTNSLIAHKSANPALPQYRYDLLRYVSPLDIDKLNYLRDYAESHGGNVEDLFVHYNLDTVLSMRTSSLSQLSHDRFLRLWHYNGASYLSKGDYYSSNTNFTFGAKTGEIVYCGYHNPFDEVAMTVTAAAGGNFTALWEYWNGASWQPLTVAGDTTSGYVKTGAVTFTVPANWKRTNVNGLPLFWARLRCTAVGAAPQFNGIKPPTYVTLNTATGYYTIPGWDASADSNGDGWLSPAEWANRSPGKDARFKYWSRVPGREYIYAWSWMANLGSPLCVNATIAWLHKGVTDSYGGFAYDGIMFDEFLPGFNYWLYNASTRAVNPVSGGGVYEYSQPGQPNWNTANNEYNAATIAALAAIKADFNTIGKKLGVNLGRTYWPEAEQNVHFVLREMAYYSQSDTLHLTSVANNTTLAAIMKRDHANRVQSLVQHQKGLIGYLGNTPAVMARDKYLGLAMFYLLQDKSNDYFQSWYGTSYASTKSQSEYAPVAAVDIGSPNGKIPAGCTEVTGPDSHMFTLVTGVCPASGKTYSVLGREYGKAIVLVKPKPVGAATNAATFGDTSATTHTLPATADNPGGRYFLVLPDGSVETTPRSAITLRNGEAALLLKEVTSPSVLLENTLSYNPASAPPGQPIICTLVVRNTGGVAIANARGTYLLKPQENYVANSVKLNGGSVTPDPINGSTISVPIGALAAGQSVTITFQLTID